MENQTCKNCEYFTGGGTNQRCHYNPPKEILLADDNIISDFPFVKDYDFCSKFKEKVSKKRKELGKIFDKMLEYNFMQREGDFRTEINSAISGYLFKDGKIEDVPFVLEDMAKHYREEYKKQEKEILG